MKNTERKKISPWFILFTVIWTFTFSMLGIESGEGSEPTADSSPLLDTIFILASPFVLAVLYYYLYRHLKYWLVFLTAPLVGIAMEWLLFRPADVLSESNDLEATIFFACIWAVILIPPYFLTKLADRSRRNFFLVLAGIIIFFATMIIRLVLL